MSVLGSHDIDGEEEGHVRGDEVKGAILGALAELVGDVGRHKHGHHRGPHLRKPDWRDSELAPGVEMPGEGLHPLPLVPQQNLGGFTAAFPSITYQGQLQVPYRGERLLAQAARLNTGGTAIGRLLGQFFVGVSLQQADIFGMDVELLGAVTGFGIRMTMRQAPPGVLMRVLVTITLVPTPTDTVTLSDMILLGRVVH